MPEAAKSAISDIRQTGLGSIPILQNLTVVLFQGNNRVVASDSGYEFPVIFKITRQFNMSVAELQATNMVSWHAIS